MTTPEILYGIETEVVGSAVGLWKERVEEVKKAILILISEADSKDLSSIVPQVRALINSLDIPDGMEDAALAGILKAHRFGVEVVANALDDELPEVKLSGNSQNAVQGLSMGAQSALDEAKQNLSRPLIGTGAQSILAAVGPLLSNPSKAERAVTWAVNNASNSAVSKLTLEKGEQLTWISERNGCIHCLAYSGKRGTLTGFPKGLTFGAKPLEQEGETIPHPPLHPNCRCMVEPGISDDYAQALERESVRSVLRGFKMESESEKVRIDAAKRLLEEDPVAPESVKKYARRKIKNFEAEKTVKTAKKVEESIEGKDFRNMTNAEKIKAAEVMYGTNSAEHRAAKKRFGKK